MAVVGLVLLIACANVANLLLARSTARRREIAVRLALGAGRARLIRQLLTESVLLAALGGALGLLLAWWGSHLLLALISSNSNPIALQVDPDPTVLAFTVGVSLLTAILFGLAPAIRSTRIDLASGLKESPASVSGARSGRLSLRKTLVAGQTAMSLLLLIGAGLFVRTLSNLEKQNLGFDRTHLLLFGLEPELNGYKDARLASLYAQLLERLRALPGVKSAAYSQHALISNSSSITTGVVVEGQDPNHKDTARLYSNVVSPGFLDTMGIPLLLGRDIGPQDTASSPQVALINEAMARHFFPDQNPIGKWYSRGNLPGHEPKRITVVGLVRDAKYTNLRQQPPATVYLPYVQHLSSVGEAHFELRTYGPPTALVPAVRQTVQNLDKDLPLFNVTTQEEQIADSITQERLFAKLTSFFGLLALLLASLGLYGLMAYAVVQRTHEIGIRMALGAQRNVLVRMILGESLVLVLAGAAVGLVAALPSMRFLSSFLFDLKPNDPATIAAAVLLMLLVAGLAAYFPARRASRVDPMVALRYE